MRTLPILSGAALVLLVAGATVAASPPPSPSLNPSSSPMPIASPTASPGATNTSPSTTTAGQTWSATIQPLHQTTGTAQLVAAANGSGTLTVTLDGLRADARWTVDIDGGTLPDLSESAANDIAFRAGAGVDKTSSRTLTIHLTKREMQDFSAALNTRGVVVMVSDGVNQSAATFPKA